MSDSELVVIQTFNNRAEADLAKSALEAAGIDSFVSCDDAGGMRPGLFALGAVELVVRVEDAQAAHDVLDLPAKPSQ
jgi:hypothetical protein